jgi:hypothetical protein
LHRCAQYSSVVPEYSTMFEPSTQALSIWMYSLTSGLQTCDARLIVRPLLMEVSVVGSAQITFMPALEALIPPVEHEPEIPPTQAKLEQESKLSPTSYSVPSGQVHVPPHAPTPGERKYTLEVALQTALMPWLEEPSPLLEHTPGSPPTQAKLAQESRLSPTSYCVPSGQVQVPPHAPTSDAAKYRLGLGDRPACSEEKE